MVKDSKQLSNELLRMYIIELDLAMRNDYDKCDIIMRDAKRDIFIEKLKEFEEKIKEECW